MASKVIVEDFSGSGTLRATSPGELVGISGASWSTTNQTGGASNNALTRGSGGATAVLPLATFARLDPAGFELTHTSGVTVVQASVRPGMQLQIRFDVDDSLISLIINPSGSGTWSFLGLGPGGSGSFSGSAVSDPVVMRIELTTTQCRFYIDNVLKVTHGEGMYSGAVITAIRLADQATFANGLPNGTTVVALRELQVKTETVSGPLGPAGVSGLIDAPSPLGAAELWAGVGRFAQIAAPSPLGAPAVFADHDFSGLLSTGGAVEFYVCDIIDGGVTTRAPVSSWQGTLQLDGAAYLQAVIPGVADLASTIAGMSTEAVFVISRGAMLPDGTTIISEIARSLVEDYQLDQGAQRYTCTISGYSGAVVAPEGGGPPVRVLRDVRSISSGAGSGFRVRCAVDWFLRPGCSAQAGSVPLVPDWINYYVGGGDAYMDAGERA